MGDDWCKSHVIKNNRNFHFYQIFISYILIILFSSMTRARAETCQKCNCSFCANIRLIKEKYSQNGSCTVFYIFRLTMEHKCITGINIRSQQSILIFGYVRSSVRSFVLHHKHCNNLYLYLGMFICLSVSINE